MKTISDIERAYGKPLFDWQRQALISGMAQPGPQQRLCLYYKTGAGKTLTSLAAVALWGYSRVLVVAPPITHHQWINLGAQLGLEVETMSHAKFRMKDTKVRRDVPVVADEMHLFGGHRGKGWIKLRGLAGGLQAPLVLASATPNYNDVERVYCIQAILDPHSVKGGFLEFIYKHCDTEANPFAQMPNVIGFRSYTNAADYLADLDKVEYLPDDLVYTIDDYPVTVPLPHAFVDFGLNERAGRIVASQMEERHARINLSLINDIGLLNYVVTAELDAIIKAADTPVLIFAVHATVAEATHAALIQRGYDSMLVTGSTPARVRNQIIDSFRRNRAEVLIGTASLATGTDGLDKVCNTLVILDDTDDDSLRRQVIGRIMPRGDTSDASNKSVRRFVLHSSLPTP